MKFTDQQLAAIERRDSSILVSAGAGTGKTSVLVERFVRAVCEDGVDVASILAITFTEKAAAQLKQRVRARFVDLNEIGHAREAEAAWISTIHGFCARVLRTHALAAGIDPEFRVLDAVEAERLALDAFDGALAEFLERGESAERLRMIAAYNPRKLADMVRTAYDHMRSQGKEPVLPVIDPPEPAGEREALQAAAAAAVAELGAPEQKTVIAALDKVERCSALLDRLAPGALAGHAEVKGLCPKGTAKALQGPAYAAYRDAHAAYAALCLRHAEYLDHVLLRELIELHGDRYAKLKRDRSGLDFDDLELLARDLLRDDEGLRLHYAERFSHVLVDEFQDTNPLQNEIVELLERENLFRVGDERQSIYRFRHADVKVFREHHARAAQEGRAEAIGVNFRSRGEVLDAIDLAFSELWGEEFDPLIEAPGTREQPPRVDPCVELLVTDKEKKRWDEALDPAEDPFGSGMRGVTPWRAAEARLLAKRVDELTKDGPYELSDVVLLLRATTHMHIYERALEERGIPTYVLGGRGYWSQQQVGDLRNYLAALANPLDGLALYSVLASPLGGLTLDSLVLIAAEARRRKWDPWRTLTDPEAEIGLEPEQAKRAAAFAERFAAERALAPRISLETLIDRAVTTSGYDREVLAMPAGDRRMANVRKLMRMAREYEGEEGRDLRGFIDFVAERDLVQEREGQAPLEAEDLDAVRLMTIHRAKGLEFPVVCVADLGKDGREDFKALRITDDGRVGIRLATLGGGTMDGAQLETIRQEQKIEDEEEERRIFYVAATRAKEHLILSGATDLEKRESPGAAAGADALDLAGAGARPGHRRVGGRVPGARRAGALPGAAAGRRPAPRRGRPRSGTARARAARPRRARGPGAGGGADPGGAAGEPAQLLGPGGLRPLRLPLLPRESAEAAAAGRRARARRRPGRAAPHAARLACAPAARAARLRGAPGARPGGSHGADRVLRPARARPRGGRPVRHGRALRRQCAAESGSQRPTRFAPSFPSSSPSTPRAAACW